MHLDTLPDDAPTGDGPMDLNAVRDVSRAVSAAHLFIYLVPETAEEAAELGVTDRGPAYLAFRSAAMGAVPWQVTLAAFYNFSPRAVRAMAGVWDAAPPEQWQAARFLAAGRAMRRVNVHFTDDHLAEARSLIDPVVAGADYAGKVLAAANASVALPPILSSHSGSRSRWRASGAATPISSYSPTTASGPATASFCTPQPAASPQLWREQPAGGTTRSGARRRHASSRAAGSTPTAWSPTLAARHASASKWRQTSTAPRYGHRSATQAPAASPRSSSRSPTRSPQQGCFRPFADDLISHKRSFVRARSTAGRRTLIGPGFVPRTRSHAKAGRTPF